MFKSLLLVLTLLLPTFATANEDKATAELVFDLEGEVGALERKLQQQRQGIVISYPTIEKWLVVAGVVLILAMFSFISHLLLKVRKLNSKVRQVEGEMASLIDWLKEINKQN